MITKESSSMSLTNETIEMSESLKTQNENAMYQVIQN